MDHIPRLSEAVYMGLCYEVGSPTEMRFRREVQRIYEILKKELFMKYDSQYMTIGELREGFRRNFDLTLMFWSRKNKIICESSQISLYSTPQNTVILMEPEDSTPGFTKLNLPVPAIDPCIRFSTEIRNNKSYISSILFHNNASRSFQTFSALHPFSGSFRLLSSYSASRNIKHDILVCFRSHHWPTDAISWIQRCRQQGWPSDIIITEILDGGYHVVPIGSTPENGLEWRISLSLAEQKLVHSMNHCQFLCYSIFKYFLNEVINCPKDIQTLFSSIAKTIVFWEIQTDIPLLWSPDNLLSCFWKCFKLFIYCVYTGKCPNFFIPQNNMFRLKVVGCMQAALFSELYNLYYKGISCLLLSQTLRPYLSQVVLNNTMGVCTVESSIISSAELDVSFMHELFPLTMEISSLRDFEALMKQFKKEIKRSLSPYERVTLQYVVSQMFRSTAMLIKSCSTYSRKICNKAFYKADKVSALIKLSCSIGPVTEILYLAMYFYRTSRCEHSLSCLQKVREELSLPYNCLGNLDMYRYSLAGMSLGNRIRKSLVTHVVLHSKYNYINEIVLEQEEVQRKGIGLLCIPPLVMLQMLFVLNYHRLGDTVTSQQSLQDLQTLLLYNNGVYVPHNLRDISWQILGICQLICGDYFGSLESYQCSLKYPFHNIQDATLLRINSINHVLN